MKYRLTFFKGKKKHDLIIIDDFLPRRGSPWREIEFNALLKNFSSSKILVTERSFHFESNKEFDDQLKKLKIEYPLLASKIEKVNHLENINAKLVYTLFFSNIDWLYPFFKRYRVPFAFSLYPGGRFRLQHSISDRLKEIISSDLCKFVIVNQRTTYNYLVEELQLPEAKINLIFGVPLELNDNSPKYQEKRELNCLFIAHKYMPFGLDKGFDTFLSIARVLSKKEHIKFHVIGDFSGQDSLIGELENITYHGTLIDKKLNDVLVKMDLVISPNRKNVLGPGAFDGFPLGSPLLAGLKGACMLLTNPMNESPELIKEDIDYIKIDNDFLSISEIIMTLDADRQRMKTIALNGLQKIKTLYSANEQVERRLKLFERFL